jgi:hypothetical protein
MDEAKISAYELMALDAISQGMTASEYVDAYLDRRFYPDATEEDD